MATSALELYEAVSKSNVNVGGDVIEQSGQAYVVRGIGLLNNIDEIKNVVINNVKGTPIYVKTIAEVTWSLPCLGWDRWDETVTRTWWKAIVVMRKGENPSRGDQKSEAQNTGLEHQYPYRPM